MQESLEKIVSDVWLIVLSITELFLDWFSAVLWASSRWSFCFSSCFIFAWWTFLILCYMTRVVDVSMICFESISLKRTLEERKLEEADELDESDDDDADERERDTWEKRKWRWLRLLLTAIATSTLTRLWRRVEAIINSDDSSEVNKVAVTAVSSDDSNE